ncbi:MAG: chorismate synthase [Bacteroidia bacterium]
MSGNSFGEIFRITTFGESHGEAVGVVIDGCPPLIPVDLKFIRSELRRRKPGQSSITSSRQEKDEFEILSGVFEGKTTGAPLAMIIRNKDQHSSDYEFLKDIYRPSHADYTYEKKYGIRDHLGGGRSSARETVARVLAGAIGKLFLRSNGITVQAYVSQVGKIFTAKKYTELNLSKTEKNSVRCPDEAVAKKMISEIDAAKKSGDTLGGIITCVIKNTVVGLGEPVFDKLHADLGKAMLSINACKGFEIGSGFSGAEMKGSEHNDAWRTTNNKLQTSNSKLQTITNNSGGVQGGISNGEDIYFRCAFKPVSSIRMNQNTVNKNLQNIHIQISGRHDPCVVPRAVPVVEAMAAIVMTDHFLRNKIYQ